MKLGTLTVRRAVSCGAVVFALVLGACATGDITYTSLSAATRAAGRGIQKNLPAGMKLALISLETSDLENYFIDAMNTTLVSSGRYQIFDRQFLEARAREMNFQLGGDVSDEDQRALGRMGGAEAIISTRVVSLGGQKIKFFIKAIDVESGRVYSSCEGIVESAEAATLIARVPVQAAARSAPTPPPVRTSTAPQTSTSRSAPASITIRNNTGTVIYYVNVSPSSSTEWGADRLGSSETLANGATVNITLEDPLSSVDRYDFRLTDRDGNRFIKSNVQVSQGATISFTQSDLSVSSRPNTSAPGAGQPYIVIRNNTGATIWYVNVSPITSDSWGADRLGSSETLSNGATVNIVLDEPITSSSRYDIRITDNERNNYVKRNVQVTQGGEITFTRSDFHSSGTSSSGSSGGTPSGGGLSTPFSQSGTMSAQ